jgi:transketolase
MSYEELLKATALADERYVVMTSENRALVKGLPPFLKDRFIDTGITEQTMIGAAAGLALRGRIPVAHALASFLTMRAFEFIRTDVGIANLPVKMSSYVPGFLSDGNGPTHQAIEDVSIMRGIPGMQVFALADEQDLVNALPKIWSSPHPSYVRINTRKSDFQHTNDFEIGKAEVVSSGKDVTLLVYGLLFEETLKAKALLEKEGLSVGLVNIRTVKPIDEKLILDIARKSELLVTIEDHFLIGGLYSILAETFLRHQMTAKVLPLSLNERWFKPALLQEVLNHEGFTAEKIAGKVIVALNKKTVSNV